jgi:hypothetical protein
MDWKNYLRKIQVVESQVPEELRIKYSNMKHRLVAQFRPGDDDTMLIRYPNPIHIHRIYGLWSFRTADLQSGRKIIVPFVEFTRYGLSSAKGTQNGNIVPLATVAWAYEHENSASNYFSDYIRIAAQIHERRIVHLDYAESKQRYDEYLRSPEWKERRDRIVKRDRGQCQSCTSKSQLQVHHMTYERIGNEHDDDLVTVCHACHQRIHGRKLS